MSNKSKGESDMYTYRNATKEDLKEVAKVHTKCFEDYFLTSLGTDLLEKYYGEYFDENAPFIVAQEDNGEIVGFCMGYQTGTKARSQFESKYKFQLASKLLCLCLKFDKEAWKRVIAKIKSVLKPTAKPVKETEGSDEIMGDILSICVLDKAKGKGVATALVQHFESEMISRGIKTYTLSVYAINVRARAFYEKMGMKVSRANDEEVVYIKTIE